MKKIEAFGCAAVVLLIASVTLIASATTPEYEDLEYIEWDRTTSKQLLENYKQIHAEDKYDSDSGKYYVTLEGMKNITTFAKSQYNLADGALDEIDQFKVSPKLKPIKDEYKLVLVNTTWMAYYRLKAANAGISGDFKGSSENRKKSYKYKFLDNLIAHQKNVNAFMKAYNDKITWRQKGDSFRKRGNYEEAIGAYDKALAIYPNDETIWDNKAICLYELERYGEVVYACDKSIELDPEDKKTWCVKGIALDALEKYEDAIKAFNKAIELDPNYEYAWCFKGHAFKSLEKYEDALMAYDKALEINPKDEGTWCLKGDISVILGRYEDAIEAYDKALKLDTSDESVREKREIAYNAYNNSKLKHQQTKCLDSFRLGEYEKAVECIDKVIEQNPNNTYAYSFRGLAYCYLEQYERAIVDFNKAIELNPNDVDAYFGRGLAYQGLKQYEKAIEDCNRTIEMDPNYKMAIELREQVCEKLEGQKSSHTPPTQPAFEAIFTIAGLLAVTFLIKRNKKRRRR